MFLSKIKMATTLALCATAVVALMAGWFASTGSAQNPKKPLSHQLHESLAQTESDEQFIRRVSTDLRGTEPTPAEIHFFVTSKDKGKKQKLIDLFIQERQAKQKGDELLYYESAAVTLRATVRFHDLKQYESLAVTYFTIAPPSLDSLQKRFYEELQAAKDKGDVARVTQAYLDQLGQYVKDRSKNEDVPQAMLQIIRLYQSQAKNVEADAWRGKLLKEHPQSAAAKAVQ